MLIETPAAPPPCPRSHHHLRHHRHLIKSQRHHPLAEILSEVIHVDHRHPVIALHVDPAARARGPVGASGFDLSHPHAGCGTPVCRSARWRAPPPSPNAPKRDHALQLRHPGAQRRQLRGGIVQGRRGSRSRRRTKTRTRTSRRRGVHAPILTSKGRGREAGFISFYTHV